MSTLIEKRSTWLIWLASDDRHSIKHQVWDMIWDAAAFRTVNEARRFTEVDENDSPKANGLMHGLLNRCFFSTQLATIRRLIDSKKSVYSMKRLLDDIQRNVSLLTRKNILDAEGITCASQNSELVNSASNPEPVDTYSLLNRHKEIDWLCGVPSSDRSADDRVKPQVIKSLSSRLDQSCSKIKLHVDNFVAHAAKPGSRAADAADEVVITLGELWKAHEIICCTLNFVSRLLLGDTQYFPLGNPIAYDQFQHLDQPLISVKHLPKLHAQWDRFKQDAQAWANWGPKEYESEFGAP